MNFAFSLPLIALSLANLDGGESARILAVIAVPSYSHQAFFRPLWQEYLNRGHFLTLITTDPMPNEMVPAKFAHHLRQIDLSMVYDDKDSKFDAIMKLRNDKIGEMNFFFEYMLNVTRRELLHPEVQDLFTNTSHAFDLLLIEDIALHMYVFKHRFDVPCIALGSLEVMPVTYEIVGNPIHPVLYPLVIMPAELLGEHGVIKRFLMLSFELLARWYVNNYVVVDIDRMIKEVLPGQQIPSVLELQQRIDMLFTNANPVFNPVRPLARTTVSLTGGLHTVRATDIPKDLLQFLDSASQGVIYFSLGTNVPGKLIPISLRNKFLEAFRQIPYKVLWKFELDHLENQPENVRIIKWCPQQAVLRHRNVKAFISQGGIQSLEESLLAGVPQVTIPFFFDQESNAKKVVASGIGVELAYETFTSGDLKAAILDVVESVKYRDRARNYSALIGDRAQTPLEEAIWNTEYLLRHGNANFLRPPVIPWWQFYFVDVFCLVVGALVVIVGVIWGITRCICRRNVKQRKGKAKIH